MPKRLDIYTTVIMVITLTVTMLWPIEQSLPAPKGSDKLLHFSAFAALALPFACTKRFGFTSILIVASCFGAVIELLQPTFNRNADVIDWIADALGVLFGICLGLVYRLTRQYSA